MAFVVDARVRRFRLRALVLGLALFGASSCGKSSDEQSGAGGPGSGAPGDSGEAGNAGSAGSAGLGGTSSPGGAGGAGDSGSGGVSGGAGTLSGAGGAGNAGAAGTGGSSGAAGVTYATCQFGSGIARIVVAKRDPARDRCVVLVLSQPGSDTLGLTLPMSWGVESAFYSTPATADCLIRFPSTGAVSAESGTGTVTHSTGFIVDVDVTLAFPDSVMENLEATGLDASRGCPL
jgi:hypothetical protein